MNDADFNAQCARISRLFAKWYDLLLPGWKVSMEYVRENFQSNGESAPETPACCAVRWEYMTAIVSWNMPEVAHNDDEGLEHILVHELCHVLVAETREWDDDQPRASLMHEERVVEGIARAIARVHAR